MKYWEATNGTLLKALVTSFQGGTRLETVLKQTEQQAGDGWDALAVRLQRDLVAAPSKSASPSAANDEKLGGLLSEVQDALKDERHWSVVDVADRAENAAGLARAVVGAFGVVESSCDEGCVDCRDHAKNTEG